MEKRHEEEAIVGSFESSFEQLQADLARILPILLCILAVISFSLKGESPFIRPAIMSDFPVSISALDTPASPHKLERLNKIEAIKERLQHFDYNNTFLYGVPYDGHPTYIERNLLMWINSARMGISRFKSQYFKPKTVLEGRKSSAPLYFQDLFTPKFYPETTPLLWSPALYRAAAEEAKNHLAIISGKDIQDLGEWPKQLVAIGKKSEDQLDILNEFLCEPYRLRSGDMDCEADSSDSRSNSQRRMLLSSSQKVAAISYTEQPTKKDQGVYTVFFGEWSANTKTAISVASHGRAEQHFSTYFSNSSLPSVVMFVAAYVDPYNESLKDCKVNINGYAFTCRLWMGTASKGIFHFEHDFKENDVVKNKAGPCQKYYFLFTDSKGFTHRYPEKGSLLTQGISICEDNYSEE